MHHKYVVKDYNENEKSGFVLFGSMNWTTSAFMNNYEDVIFVSDSGVVEAFHNDFEQMSSFLEDESKNNAFVTAVLNNKVCIE